MVIIREKQTDWKSIISEFFGTTGISLKKEDDEIARWKQENLEILSQSEGNIMKLEKSLVQIQANKRRKQSTKTNFKTNSKEILIKNEKGQKIENINRER